MGYLCGENSGSGISGSEYLILKPERNESRRSASNSALKSKMTKLEARDALRAEVTKQTGQNLGGKILKDGSYDLRVVCSQPLFPASEGRLAAGNGEGEDVPD